MLVANIATVVAQLDALELWFGPVRLEAIRKELRARDSGPLRMTQQLNRKWVARDLLTYIEARDQKRTTERLIIEHLAPLGRFASAVLRFNQSGTMALPGSYRDLLLGDACADYAFEVIAAAHHNAKGYQIRWLGHGERGGEFAARLRPGDCEIFVECKRLAPDVAIELKEPEVAQLADVLDGVLNNRSLCGALRVQVGPAHVGRPSLVEVIRQLAEQLVGGRGELQMEDVAVSYSLAPSEDATIPYTDLMEHSRTDAEVYRVITGDRDGEVVKRPRMFEFSGPLRDLARFAQKIESVLVDNAADRQLNSNAPGVVCIELPMFRDVDPQAVLALVPQTVDTLFDRDHIVGLLAVLDRTIKVSAGLAAVGASGRVVPNLRTRFGSSMQQWFERLS